MSSVRGGSTAGRGRGGSGPFNNARGASNVRGRGTSRGRATQGGSVSQRGLKAPTGPRAVKPPTGPASRAHSGTRPAQSIPKSSAGANEDIADRYARLKRDRDLERADAIKRGLLADPDKPRALADAITPIGTCQDMCAEYERVERTVRNEVWDEEKDQNHSAYSRAEAPMDEYRMVKIFKRSAAGDEEQLPSDLRPPAVLMRTCDYLFNDLIGNAPSLAKVHNFVWNRTRAIRRDFSIQQLTKPEDLQIAIDCYERIARFHILALHELALATKPYPEYDYKQDREQLDKTLLSLMQYYDDSRSRVDLHNEAEFRAYCVIFQLQDFTPDLEDRVQTWPAAVAGDARVQTALRVYAAAGSAADVKGPLKTSAIEQFHAQQDWQSFFSIVDSTAVSFLLGCVAEVFFNSIRHQVLDCLVRSAPRLRAKGPTNANHFLDVEELVDLLAFDDEDEVIKFCGRYDFPVVEQDDGRQYVNISSSAGVSLSAPQLAAPPLKSSLIENKRYGRAFPAIISGMTVKAACEAGLVREEDESMQTGMEEEMDDFAENTASGAYEEEEDANSLFIPDTTKKTVNREPSPFSSAAAKTFEQAPASTTSPFGFGKPSGGTQPSATTRSPFAPVDSAQTSAPVAEKSSAFSLFSKPAADTLAAPSGLGNSIFSSKTQSTTTSSGFNFLAKPQENASTPLTPTASPFAPTAEPTQAKSEPPANTAGSATTPLFQWSSKPPTESTPKLPSFGLSSTPAPSPFNIGQSNDTHAAGVQSSTFASPSALFSPPASTLPPTQTSNSASTLFPLNSTPAPEQNLSDKSNLASTFSTANPTPPTSPMPSTLPNDTASNAQSTTFAAASPTSTNSKPNAAPQNGNSLSVDEQKLRRNSETTRPRKPSPLSHSFSASDEQTGDSLFGGKNAGGATTDPPAFLLPGNPTNQNNTSSNATAKAQPNEAAIFEAIVSKLAEEITNDPYRGIITQFVEFFAGQVITQTQEKVYAERVNKEANDFRKFSLSFRYGKQWREKARRARLARQGRERRRRAQERLRESSVRGGSDAGSVTDTSSVSNRIARASTLGRSQQVSRHVEVDALFQSTNGGSRYSADRLASAGSKRSAAYTLDNSRSTLELGHKRIKSDDHNTHRRSTVANTNDPQADLARRSAFLGFSLPRDAVDRGTTTKSSYFKLKAMGINPNSDFMPAPGVKRIRSGSTKPEPAPVSQAVTIVQHDTSLRALSPNTGSMLPPPPRAAKSRLSDPDEALFARLKAAREGLKDESILMKSTISQKNDSPPSVASRSAAGDSPSLVLARAEARLRASRDSYGSAFGSARKEREVPAYRLRESRFVPKEHYSRAIERANAIRSNRSRASSVAGSQMGDSQPPSPIDEGREGSQAFRVRERSISAQPVSPLLKQSLDDSPRPSASRNGWNGRDTTEPIYVPEPVFLPAQEATESISHMMEVEDPPAPAPSFSTAILEQLQQTNHGQPQLTKLNTIPHDPFQSQGVSYGLPPFVPHAEWSFASTTELATPTQDGSRRPSQDLLVAGTPDASAVLDPELTQDTLQSHAIEESQVPTDGPQILLEDEPMRIDHTIPLEEIPAALSASFGTAQLPPHLNQEVIAESYNPYVPEVVSKPANNETQLSKTEMLAADARPRLNHKPSFASINPFAALAGADDDSEGGSEEQEISDTEVDGEPVEDEEEDELDDQLRDCPPTAKLSHPAASEYDEDEDEDMEQDNRAPHAPNGFYHGHRESEEGSEGDVEDFDDELEDEEGEEGGYDEEYDSEMVDEDDISGEDDQSDGMSAGNPVLQGVGGTADEAIELSD